MAMADPQDNRPRQSAAAPKRKPLKTVIEPGHRRPPSGRLGEIELLNDSHGDPTRDPRSLKPAPQSRWWFFVFAIVLVIAVVGFGLIFVASESTESPAFRERAEAILSEQLQAKVELAPISASSFFFVHVPEIRISPRREEESWAVRLENVNFEIDRKSLTSENWKFHQFQVATVEIDLGPGFPMLGDVEFDPTEPSAAARLAQWINLGAFDTPDLIEIPEMRAAKVLIRGWKGDGADGPGFELEAPARGAYENGVLRFEASDGSFKTGESGEVWKIEEFAAVIDGRSGIVSLDAGKLVGENGAKIEIQRPGEGQQLLVLEIDAEKVPVGPAGGERFDAVFESLVGTGRGKLTLPLNDPFAFQFRGPFKFSGVQLSRSSLFELLANQTGDNRLRRLTGDSMAADIDWTPERLRFDKLVMEVENVVRLSGGAELAEAGFSGELQVEFPASVIAQMPGGKPVEFSYPASGWSQATFQIGGDPQKITENLSSRLLAQVAPDVTVSAAPLIDSAAGPNVGLSPADQAERQKRIEELFFELIDE
ncbi:MAG: hypothetical protein ACI8UO_002669 [Verrucomicrobiales bacterium]|jgi:hypothetical protein